MNRTSFLALLLTGVLIGGLAFAAENEKLYYVAPTRIPHVTREMKTAGFWIGRIPKPDKPLMNSQAIEAFNRHVQQKLKLTKDLTEIEDPYPGSELKEKLLAVFNELQGKNYFSEDGQLAPASYFEENTKAMALDQIPDSIKVRYGFIVHFADQRFLPTEKGLYAAAGDIDFDEVQNSDLDAGTPIVILHQSTDKRWLYVLAEASDGWVRAENVALSTQDDFEEFLASRSLVVVTDDKADIYLNEGLTEFYDHLRMGSRLPAVDDEDADYFAAKLPMRKKKGELQMKTVYIRRSQASAGYLEFTPRQVLEEAFKLLNDPYGWGGMNGEQDCSRFLKEVFATVGINLPRDSKDQAKIGKALAQFDEATPLEAKTAALRNAPVGGSLLPMKGHIMLYLGMVDNRPYAIHAVWGYREGTPEGDQVRVINRVTVSDLDLGQGSKKGSLLQRLNAVVALRNP